MGERICPGLPADWLNGWLAAIGATALVPGMHLRWSDEPIPVAVLALPHHDPADALCRALPTAETIEGLPIARVLDGVETIGLNLTFDQFQERATIARCDTHGWTLSSFYSDAIFTKGAPATDRGPFLPPMPGKVNALQDRLAKLVDAAQAQDLSASLDGLGRRVQQFGIGFDVSRIGSLSDETNMWVDPIIELLAFAGLSLFPTRGDGHETARQRGWTGRKLGRGGFRWPTWTESIDVDAIDALLDVYWSGTAPGRLGLLGEWETVPYEGTGQADATRGLGSARVPNDVTPRRGAHR